MDEIYYFLKIICIYFSSLLVHLNNNIICDNQSIKNHTPQQEYKSLTEYDHTPFFPFLPFPSPSSTKYWYFKISILLSFLSVWTFCFLQLAEFAFLLIRLVSAPDHRSLCSFSCTIYTFYPFLLPLPLWLCLEAQIFCFLFSFDAPCDLKTKSVLLGFESFILRNCSQADELTSKHK